jgi:hypothetical protein
MPTMAELAGLQPVSMAQAAGLTPVTPDQPQIDTPQNQAMIARRNREAAAAADFKKSVAQDTSPGLLASIGRGAKDIAQGVQQGVLKLTDPINDRNVTMTQFDPKTGQNAKVTQTIPTSDEYTKGVNIERSQYDKSRADAGETGIDWGRVFGVGAATLPAAALTPEVAGPAWLARLAGGATTGAAAGATEFAPTNSILERATNAAIGGATGAVAAPVAGAVGDAAGSVYRKVAGRVAGARELIQPTTEEDVLRQVPEIANVPEAQRGDLIAEAQAQMKQAGAMNAEQLARKANLLSQGGVGPDGKPIFVTPTKSMVTRDAADWTKERNLQKLAQSPDESLSGPGRDLTEIYNSNDKAFTAALAKQAQGLPGGTQEAHGMTVMKSADDLAKMSQKDVTAVYDQVRAEHGNELASDAQNVTDTLSHPDVADNAYAEPIINSVTKRLKRLGMVDAEGAPTTNTMTVTQADEFRKFLGNLKSGDPKTDRIVTQIMKAHDQDVLGGAGSDAMAPARAAASARFGSLENPATQRALNAYGELNQGKTAQNFIQTNVINGADQDVSSLLDTLGKLPPEQAKTATDAIKAGVVRHLQDKAINENSGQFSGAKLNTALNDIGDTKLARIFGMQSAQELRNLARAGLDATYQPPYSAVNNSNTTPMLLSLTRGARVIPGMPLLVSEEAQKLAGRVGYAGQLKEIRAAQTQAPVKEVPDILKQIAGLLPRAAGPVGGVVAGKDVRR